MGSRAKKKARTLPQHLGDEDRISRLPDELIHKILSFVDAKQAVETGTLSRRWRFLWTTLPFLSFGPYENSEPKNVGKLIRHVLSKRNHQSHVSDLKFCVYEKGCSEKLFEYFVDYASFHGVQSLYLELSPDYKPFKLSTFNSMSLNKLTLNVRLEECELQSGVWDLPALTSLDLKHVCGYEDLYRSNSWLKDSLFTCLPALTTLSLDDWNLSQLSSFSLPGLTSLCLSRCSLPKVWDFPNLLSLQLDGERVGSNMSDNLSALVNLKNLTLSLTSNYQETFISCPPQLLNLSIKASLWSYTCNVVVSAPKLCNFTAFGILTVTVGVPELENVNISLQGWFGNMELTRRKQFYRRLTVMLSGLGNAKNLTFDLESIEALNKISKVLVSLPSPFGKLKYVKLPRGFEESSVSSALRTYLLGGSPNATFVTILPQNNGVEDPVVDANRVSHTDPSVEGTGKDQACSSRGERDSGLWRSHEVNFEFLGLLDRIMHKYPKTFEHFTTKNKKLCTMNLNMLCNSLNDFFKISVANVDSEMIREYREVFSYLHTQGINLSWMLDRLNYLEHLRFSKPLLSELHSIDCQIDDTKTKLQELQSLRVEKLSEIEKAFGTRGTNLAAGFAGDDLLASP
ncbi:putative FBD-associated F-box protein At5g53640 [Daucus carota subsp. sativus]|uniref:putative FBD-associated F-box protein At5g53640 n=1 Tax=Daucus carota subsp. sativus TaxID=79200 RepID=UPI0007EFB2FE|nr:PREDICTED: putative FBD-associated F-box protein At5g53640 [Daucus carota subsp. sativus]